MKKISIHEAFDLRVNFGSASSKEEIVLIWLLEFRKHLLENKIAVFGDVIPSKKDISKFLKVSTGTVQNAVRYAEDSGYFKSKQCIGTMISDENDKTNDVKMFSKKDKALIEIKKFLLNEGYEENETIPGIAELADDIKTSTNTVRLAIYELIQKGVVRKEVYDRKTVLILNSKIRLTEKERTGNSDIKNKNLVKILKENIKKYLVQNYKTGDKIPSNMYFAKMYKVSIRTVNSAIKELNKDKIILSRRGSYGSVFLNSGFKEAKSEKSMFMSKPGGKKELKNSYNYKWETALENIKNYILKNHEAGDRIPSMKDLAEKLNVSVTTIKKAVHELNLQGILYTQKGKYGGLFIVEMPQRDDSYQWLAINPKYFGGKNHNP